MAFSLVAHVAVQAQNDPTTGAIDTTGANLLVASIGSYGGTAIGTFSDNKGNTWTALPTYENATTRTKIWYCLTPSSVGSGHTFTYAAGVFSYTTVLVTAWSGANAYHSETGTTGGTNTTAQPGSVTPATNGSLVITAVSMASGTGTTSINSSFTISDTIEADTPAGHGGSQAYLIQGTAGAINPTWTFNSSRTYAAAIAEFAPSAGGATPSPAAGALALSGKGTNLAFTINMPDEA